MESWDERLRWFADNLHIRTKDAKIIPYRPNKIQLALNKYYYDRNVDGLPIYVIILKARQEGVSTDTEANLYRIARTQDNMRAMVIAHKDEASLNIFDMSRRFVEHEPVKPELERSSVRALHFKDNGSAIVVETAGSGKGGGRSSTCQVIHFSELDFYPDPEELMGAVMQVLPRNSQTFAVIESTANGPFGFMQELWDRAVEGRNEWKPFFFAWFDHEEYSRPLAWKDMLLAERTWVARKRQFIESKIKEEADGLDQREYSGAVGRERDHGGSGPAGPDGRRDGAEERSGGGPGEEDPGQGAPGTAGEGHLVGDGETERSRLDSGGAISGGALGRDGRGGAAGHEALDDQGGDGSVPPDGGDGREGFPALRRLDRGEDGSGSGEDGRSGLEFEFRDSLSPYEIGLQEEFDITDEQINWYRWCFETNCHGDETRMRREYPSRPEEAFQAAGADVLDPIVLSKWTKESQAMHPDVGNMVAREVKIGQVVTGLDLDPRRGHTTIWKHPEPKKKYVMGVDCASGQNVEEGDWHVAYVMDVDTGDQVAEYRSKVAPDIAVDQVEYIGIYYNVELCAIEDNAGWGVPFITHLYNRQTVKLYERETYDKGARSYLKKPGWATTTRTRPLLVAETKECVRKERCKIRSLETLRECRTLHENAVGKIEARDGKHDDGWIGYGITCVMRNKVLGVETAEMKEERRKNSFVKNVQDRWKRKQRQEKSQFRKITARVPVDQKVASGGRNRPDGRRSWI